MSEIYVATSHAGEDYHNTIALGDIEVVIPLEEDLEDDPNTPDCVRLRSEDGIYEAQLTEGDAGVERDGDNPLNFYHFPAVPAGWYAIEVKVGNDWHAVMRDLRIGRDGAFFGDTSLEGPADGSVLGTPDSDLVDDLDDDEDPDYGCC